MKEKIHPNYREVIVMDVGVDFAFKTRSTVKTKETIKWKDGKEYPLFKVSISSMSHPFYTGKQMFVDSAGRIEKFRARYKLKEGETMLSALERKQQAEDTSDAAEEKPEEQAEA